MATPDALLNYPQQVPFATVGDLVSAALAHPPNQEAGRAEPAAENN